MKIKDVCLLNKISPTSIKHRGLLARSLFGWKSLSLTVFAVRDFFVVKLVQGGGVQLRPRWSAKRNKMRVETSAAGAPGLSIILCFALLPSVHRRCALTLSGK